MKANFCVTILFVLFPFLSAHAEPLLKGSKESQLKQNAIADKFNLIRIENDVELEEMKLSGQLVPIPVTLGIKIDDRLDERLRYVLPWVATYLVELGREFHKQFNAEIQINSAVRTAEHQLHLIRNVKNPNAASVTGPKRSVHLTGSAIDIAKLPLTEIQKRWLRKKLVGHEVKNLIEATEEDNQAVFHAMIFPNYGSPPVQTAQQ